VEGTPFPQYPESFLQAETTSKIIPVCHLLFVVAQRVAGNEVFWKTAQQRALLTAS